MEKHAYIPKSWDLPDSIRQRLGQSVGKQRLMDEDGHLLLLLHAPPSSGDDEVRQAVVFWRDPSGAWRGVPHSGGLSGLDAHLSQYRDIIHKLDEKEEAARTARAYFDVLREAHPLQRSTRSLLNVMQAAREARPDETRLISLRDQAADLERGIELLVSDAKTGMDFSLAETSSQQAAAADVANREARRLNRIVAFFFPLATLVAVFGMNQPEQLFQFRSFWVVLLAGVLAGFLVYSVVSLRRK